MHACLPHCVICASARLSRDIRLRLPFSFSSKLFHLEPYVADLHTPKTNTLGEGAEILDSEVSIRHFALRKASKLTFGY